MGGITLDNLRNIIKKIFMLGTFILQDLRFNDEKYRIVSRTACFGNDIISNLGLQTITINFQKCRIDLLTKNNQSVTPKSYQRIKTALNLINHISNPEVTHMIMQQSSLRFWKTQTVHGIIMDTYSELTDQKFVLTSNDNEFMCNYSDVKQDSLRKKELECRGLISRSELQASWKEFLIEVNRKFGNVNIYVIEFPTLKEKRKKYLQQAKIIESVMKKLEKENLNLSFIQLDRSYQANDEDLREPDIYHYGYITKERVTNILKHKMNQSNRHY